MFCTQELLDELTKKARESSRGRAHHELHHLGGSDPYQRFLNGVEPASYVTPHRHPQEDRWEWFQVIRGSCALLQFSNEGQLLSRTILEASGAILGGEIGSGVWHSLLSLSSGTILLELKPGPWIAESDKEFAIWAPREGESPCGAFIEWFRSGTIGSLPPMR